MPMLPQMLTLLLTLMLLPTLTLLLMPMHPAKMQLRPTLKPLLRNLG